MSAKRAAYRNRPSQFRHIRKILISLTLFGFAVLAIVWFYRIPLMWRAGQMLTDMDAPAAADAVIVMGGDFNGWRVLKGAELARSGFAPKVITSGSGSLYGIRESAAAIDFAVDHGYPRSSFIPFQYGATSTLDEAIHVSQFARDLGFHRLIVVTSPWHTRRTRRAFHKAAPDLDVTLVGSVDKEWDGGFWWHSRDGRKIFYVEWQKTLASYAGL